MPSERAKAKAAAKKGSAKGKAAAAAAAADAPPAPAADNDAPPADAGGRPDPQPPAAGVQLLFPPSLTARQRAILHLVAEQHGLAHSSQGEGEARRIALGPPSAARTLDLCADAAAAAIADGSRPGDGTDGSAGGATSDEQLAALLRQHLSIDAASAFAASSGSSGTAVAAGRRGAAAGWKPPSKSSKPGAAGMVSVEAFIAQVLPLLELERAAEVTQAEEALAAGSPERAAARGRALLNLRLTEAEGGLLGRTLLTLVNNKVRCSAVWGEGVGNGSAPLFARGCAGECGRTEPLWLQRSPAGFACTSSTPDL